MKTMITGLIIGLLAGIIIGIIIVFFASPSLMLKESKSKFDFEKTISELQISIDDKGWKTPYIHDLQATMKKFGNDVRQVKVFDICNPDHAFKILSRSDERIVSNLMPCRIAVYEKEDGSVWLSRMNSGLIAKPMGKTIRETMSLAASDTEEIINKVISN
jgi:uncharacterized protein (DUF302 family)